MTLLLIDIGNTRVKWARLVDGKMSPQQAAANAGWTAADYARQVIGKGWAASATGAEAHVTNARRSADVEAGATSIRRSAKVESGSTGARHFTAAHRRADVDAPTGASGADRIVVSSVAGDEVNRALTEAAAKAGAPTPEFVASERTAAGITTDYIDPWRLGVDRFVAAIGAHHLSSGQPVCVVNIGTAMTVDLVDGSGRHRGGAIVPGPALMVSSLLTQTNGIRRRAKGGPDGETGMFAKTTRNAIGEGARYAAAGVIDRALEEARILVGTRPLVLLTGGGSLEIKPLIRSTCVSLPDLVLHGLAVWAHQIPATVRQTPATGRPETAGARQPKTTRARQPDATLERRPQTSRTRQPDTTLERRPQTSRARQPDTTLERRPQTSRARQPDTILERRPQTSRTRQPDTTRERRPRTPRTPLSETSRKRRPVV